MRPLPSLCICLLASLLSAQTVETVGGTTTTSQVTNGGKGNLMRIDTTVMLLDFEMLLDVPAAQTVTFFAYRIPQRNGTAVLEWTQPVAVAGGAGLQFESTGPIALPLVAGNYYLIGVAWTGTVRYQYATTASTSTVSFGAWQRARTLPQPIPASITVTGSDSAQYHQRFTTIALPNVTVVGTGCTTTQPAAPRLVLSALPTLGSQPTLHITDAAPSTAAACLLTIRPPLATPLPLFGCSVWLQLGTPTSTSLVLLDPAGAGALPLGLPANQALLGLNLTAQAGVIGPSLDLTNAVGMIVN